MVEYTYDEIKKKLHAQGAMTLVHASNVRAAWPEGSVCPCVFKLLWPSTAEYRMMKLKNPHHLYPFQSSKPCTGPRKFTFRLQSDRTATPSYVYM